MKSSNESEEQKPEGFFQKMIQAISVIPYFRQYQLITNDIKPNFGFRHFSLIPRQNKPLHYVYSEKTFPTILKTIEVLAFEKLRALVLRNSSIQNLEFIAFLEMPNLQILLLKGNEIVCAKALVKTKWNFLTKICLDKNYVSKNECRHITRLKVCKNKDLDCSLSLGMDAINRDRFGLPAQELWIKHRKVRHSGVNVSESLFKFEQNLGVNYMFQGTKEWGCCVPDLYIKYVEEVECDIPKKWVERMKGKLGKLELNANLESPFYPFG